MLKKITLWSILIEFTSAYERGGHERKGRGGGGGWQKRNYMECYSFPGLVGKSIEARQKFNLKCHINIAIQNLLSFFALIQNAVFLLDDPSKSSITWGLSVYWNNVRAKMLCVFSPHTVYRIRRLPDGGSSIRVRSKTFAFRLEIMTTLLDPSQHTSSMVCTQHG